LDRFPQSAQDQRRLEDHEQERHSREQVGFALIAGRELEDRHLAPRSSVWRGGQADSGFGGGNVTDREWIDVRFLNTD
jgi:hypothetical protein